MWLYKGKEYKEIHDDKVVGFIYLITYTDPKSKLVFKYIGKKQFYAKKTTKLSPRQISLLKDKRLTKKKVTYKQTDWLTYQSSNTFLKEVDSKHLKKEILEFCDSLSCLTYKETRSQFINRVLESEEWLNANILGKFFKQKKNEL